MTVRDLKDMLGTMDDDSTLTMLTPDGGEREIKDARLEGDHCVFLA